MAIRKEDFPSFGFKKTASWIEAVIDKKMCLPNGKKKAVVDLPAYGVHIQMDNLERDEIIKELVSRYEQAGWTSCIFEITPDSDYKEEDKNWWAKTISYELT